MIIYTAYLSITVQVLVWNWLSGVMVSVKYCSVEGCNSNSFLCCKHFKPKDINLNKEKPRLKTGAVPELYGPHTAGLLYKKQLLFSHDFEMENKFVSFDLH